ncbi:MAG: response regulator transcription factor [Pseudomonadota bacterium]
MASILIVDDDGHIREVLRFALTQAGHQVREAADGIQGWQQFERESPELLILDVVMPEQDGLELCRRIRAVSQVPIIFLSARDEELDRVLGLELGADDYLTKPFSPRELVARVKAVLRRLREPVASTEPVPLLQQGPLVLDPGRHRCTWHETEVVLTVTEFALLQALLSAPGRVLSRDALVDRAYGQDHYITDRTVDSHVRRIRKKFAALDGDPVETVYGVGYRLREDLA